jgi:hypothetical protein
VDAATARSRPRPGRAVTQPRRVAAGAPATSGARPPCGSRSASATSEHRGRGVCRRRADPGAASRREHQGPWGRSPPRRPRRPRRRTVAPRTRAARTARGGVARPRSGARSAGARADELLRSSR